MDAPWRSGGHADFRFLVKRGLPNSATGSLSWRHGSMIRCRLASASRIATLDTAPGSSPPVCLHRFLWWSKMVGGISVVR